MRRRLARPTASTLAWRPALECFCETLPQDLLVQREIGDEASEFAIFLAQEFELAQLTHAEAEVFLFPAIERRLGDFHLPADLGDGGAAFGLRQRVDDLL